MLYHNRKRYLTRIIQFEQGKKNCSDSQGQIETERVVGRKKDEWRDVC